MAIRRSIEEMWLGATLSTLLNVGSIVLIFIGLSLVALALSTDKKEPETVDNNTHAVARKVEAPAKTKASSPSQIRRNQRLRQTR